MGLPMTPLADDANQWLEAAFSIFDDDTPRLGLPVALLKRYDELIKGKIPSFYQFASVVNPKIALFWRVKQFLSATKPSLDRIASRSLNGKDKTGHTAADCQWAPWHFNYAKNNECGARTEASYSLAVLSHVANPALLPSSEVGILESGMEGLRDTYIRCSDKSSRERLTPALQEVQTLWSFSCPEQERSGPQPDAQKASAVKETAPEAGRGDEGGDGRGAAERPAGTEEGGDGKAKEEASSSSSSGSGSEDNGSVEGAALAKKGGKGKAAQQDD